MTKQQRVVLLVAILASFVAFLDGSVVNVALPAIVRDLGGGLVVQQWVVDAYLITLGSLILIAGSFSDLFGRKRVLFSGLMGFLVASLLCAAAPNGVFLIVARALQGIAGAFLVPSSLALIISTFSGKAQAKAIGSWTGWTGIAFVVGPLLGGFLIDAASWRLIFAINVVPIAVTLWLLRAVDAPRPTKTGITLDIWGAVLCVIALGAIGYALIEQAHYGWSSPLIYSTAAVGALTLAAFLWREAHTPMPMLPLELFKVRNFWVGNVATALIYGGLALATLLVIVFVQEVAGYSAIQAGMSMVPVTILMFLLSPRFGALAGRYGPRIFMTVGPLVAAAGFVWMLRVGHPMSYWSQLLPGILLFGIGLSITVAPLTAAILGAISPKQAGMGSAVNNAVSRIAGLIAIAALGVIIGPHLDVVAFHRGVLVIAALLGLGGLISFLGIRSSAPEHAQTADIA